MLLFLFRILLTLLAAFPLARSLFGQSPAWSAGLTTTYSDFHGGANDPAGISLEPTSRVELGLVLGRGSGPWQFNLALGWAPGHLSTRDSTGRMLEINLLAQSFDRYRVGTLVGRRVAGIGAGALVLEGGPLLDLWSGDDRVRPRIGGQVRLVLQAPLGGLLLRNYLGWSVEGSPFDADEFGPTIERPSLQGFSVGGELRLQF